MEALLSTLSLLINLFRRAKADPCGKESFRVALARFLFKRRPPLYALRRYLFRRRPQAIISFLNYPNIALLLAAQLGKGDARIYVNVRNNISRSEEHTSELQSLMRTSYAVFCLKKK